MNPRKYKNVPVMVGMIRFDSKAEARRYWGLKQLAEAGKITDLKRQITFALYGKNGAAICRYRADFMYQEGDKIIVEDVKGVATPVFGLKAKLFKDNYPDIELRVVR